MSIISPTQTSKPTLPMHPVFTSIERTMSQKQPTRQINEYTLYIMLEKQRNEKLKELYHRSTVLTPRVNDHQSHQDVPLPKFPPRYQCLDLSAHWFISQVEKRRRVVSVDDATKEQWKTLDRVTKTFLEDLVNILNDDDDDDACASSSQSPRRSTTPPCIPSLLSPRHITPPSSPLTLPLAVSQDSMLLLPQESLRPQARRVEGVDMSDDEIMSLWNCATPSIEGVDLDIV